MIKTPNELRVSSERVVCVRLQRWVEQCPAAIPYIGFSISVLESTKYDFWREMAVIHLGVCGSRGGREELMVKSRFHR